MADTASHSIDQAAASPVCSTDIPQGPPFDRLLPARGGLLFVLSGPGGVGKDAVLDRLRETRFPLARVVTATTRPPRPGELPGVSYHFLDRATFESRRARGELLEWAEVYAHYYGTPVASVRAALATGDPVLLKIDVQGAAQIRKRVPDAVFIFLAPESVEVLEARLDLRGSDPPDARARRMANARTEIEQIPHFDYIIVNRQGQLDCAVELLKAIITAERLRVHPRNTNL